MVDQPKDIVDLIETLRVGLLIDQEDQEGYALTSGGHSNFYVDLDYILSDPSNVERVVDQYTLKIRELQRKGIHIDRLAFIEKDSGPIGGLSLKDLLIMQTKIPAIIVRVQRRILSASIKGYPPLQHGEQILIVSDIATSGAAILKAARIIWHFEAKVPHVLVFFDRQQGADDNLKGFDIELHSILRRSDILQLHPLLKPKPSTLLFSTFSVSSTRTSP